MTERERALRAQYKEQKPPMGLLLIRSRSEPEGLLIATRDLKAARNSALFQLRMGCHRCRPLQQAFTERGEDDFSVETLDELPYEKDGDKTDYAADLEELRNLWAERLAAGLGLRLWPAPGAIR